MSLSFMNDEQILLDHSSWDDFPHVFDESAGVKYAGFGDLDWMTTNIMGSKSSEQQDFPSTAKLVDSVYATSEGSLSTSPAGDNHSSEEKQKTKAIGRPKLKLKGNQTAADRRRAQVRVAQQAYRQRKEEALSTLRSEQGELKESLDNLAQLFDQLFDLSVKASLSTRDETLACQLKEASKKFRRGRSNSGQSTEDTDSADSKTSATKLTKNEIPKPAGNKGTPAWLETTTWPEPPKATSDPNNFQDTLNLGAFAWQASSDKVLHASTTNISFSMQLRYGGLKRGYSLMTIPEVPYPSMFRAFKFCIFSNSRDQIQKQIESQLYELSRYSYATYDTLTNTTFESMRSSKWWEQDSFPSTEFVEDNNFVELAPDEEYVDPDGVEQYLVQKGLSIVPGSTFVALRTSLGPFLNTKNERSMFDEMGGEKSVLLDVGKLLHELLTHAVCLKSGPGFRKSDVDDSIRSTILAAL